MTPLQVLLSHPAYPSILPSFAPHCCVMMHPTKLLAYPVISFSCQRGAIQGYNFLAANLRPFLIPLPPLLAHHATSPLLGNPLTLTGGFTLDRDLWLFINLCTFTMPKNRQVSFIPFFAVCNFQHRFATVQVVQSPGLPDSQTVASD